VTDRTIGPALVGPGQPVYLVGEIGINHNGSVDLALELVDAAKEAGFNAVKFQKRTPRICVPPGQWDLPRQTPWGDMTYLEYRHRLEFDHAAYQAIDAHCRAVGIAWFASPWDVPSVEFLEQFDPPAHKIASPCLTDTELLKAVNATGRTVILSTGMSTMEQVHQAVRHLDQGRLILTHATSSYPAKPAELNLRMVQTLARAYPGVPVGYSGHETGLQATVAAVALGACLLERHITLDRAMWGTDQAASVEPEGMRRLVRDVRVVEMALGDGVKAVYPSELAAMVKLRRTDQ
jgi:sialic acid synthase SpsE